MSGSRAAIDAPLEFETAGATSAGGARINRALPENCELHATKSYREEARRVAGG